MDLSLWNSQQLWSVEHCWSSNLWLTNWNVYGYEENKCNLYCCVYSPFFEIFLNTEPISYKIAYVPPSAWQWERIRVDKHEFQWDDKSMVRPQASTSLLFVFRTLIGVWSHTLEIPQHIKYLLSCFNVPFNRDTHLPTMPLYNPPPIYDFPPFLSLSTWLIIIPY